MKKVPRVQYLESRDGHYYFRRRVPTDLIPIIGKTFLKKTLNTSSYKEAGDLARLEAAKTDQEFENARRQNQKTPLNSLSQGEIERMALLYFHEQNRKAIIEATQMLTEPLNAEEIWDLKQTLMADATIWTSPGHVQERLPSASNAAEKILKMHNVAVDRSHHNFHLLCQLVIRAEGEISKRNLDRYISPAHFPCR